MGQKCTVCHKEIKEGGKAYATAAGSIECYSTNDEEGLGFFASDIEPWVAVLCEPCGLKVHDFIAGFQRKES
jgi:hypothetical protein